MLQRTQATPEEQHAAALEVATDLVKRTARG
jgi:hypothetical protein